MERYDDDSWNTDDEDWDYTDNEDESSKDSGISIKKRKTHNTVDDGDKNIYLQRLQEWQDTRNEAAELDYEELEGGMRVPASLWTSLYHYQKVAVQWLWELHQQDVGGILGVCNFTDYDFLTVPNTILYFILKYPRTKWDLEKQFR